MSETKALGHQPHGPIYHEIHKCRISSSTNLISILNLGRMALTGKFPKGPSVVGVAPLELVLCPDSGLVQLKHSCNLEELYGANYGYRSGLNRGMVSHLQNKAKHLSRQYRLRDDSIVLDIGSNDGTLLHAFGNRYRRFGIDPTAEYFRQYYEPGIQLVDGFFNADVFQAICPGKAHIITSIAMFYDLEKPVDFARNVQMVLAENGVWHFEQSYLPSMLRMNSYDTVCHEHLEYYSLRAIQSILQQADLDIIDVSLNSINGGSFAVTAAHKHSKQTASRQVEVQWLLEQEDMANLMAAESYQEFAAGAVRNKEQLTRLIGSLKADGKRVLGYGASTKGNVILQHCGFTSDDLDAIAEVNAEKFGRVTPGTNIPIISESEAKAMRPDYFLVLPWHFREGIIEREQDFIAHGGRFIFPLPEIEIV